MYVYAVYNLPPFGSRRERNEKKKMKNERLQNERDYKVRGKHAEKKKSIERRVCFMVFQQTKIKTDKLTDSIVEWKSCCFCCCQLWICSFELSAAKAKNCTKNANVDFDESIH